MITLDPGEPGPLYLQIATRLRSAIATGALTSGTRLPSARTLSSQLGVARGTIDAAYDLLAGEGAIEPRGAAGTVVSAQVGAMAPVQPALGLGRDRTAPWPGPMPLQRGLPALDAFPQKLWAALTAKAARAMTEADLGYPDPCGAMPLREEIAAYLGLARGIVCGPHRVIVTAGYQGALTLVREVLLKPGDPVWVEDPGHAQAFQALEVGGAALIPVPVDGEGMRVSAGVAAGKAKLAVVTPTHQAPLGVSLSLPRRLALLAWAEDARAWILEDDYDAEFQYAGPVPASLASIDRGGRVIFAGSFSKTLFPGLRLGYLVVPDALIETFARAARLTTRGPPLLEQTVLAAFMAGGHFARHVKRMRGLYARRRAALAQAVTAAGFTVELAAGGMHLLMRLPDGVDDGDVVRRAMAAGLAPTALSGSGIAFGTGGGLLLGFTNVREEEAGALAGRLAAVVKGG